MNGTQIVEENMLIQPETLFIVVGTILFFGFIGFIIYQLLNNG
jgi:hypothetical protein